MGQMSKAFLEENFAGSGLAPTFFVGGKPMTEKNLGDQEIYLGMEK